MITWDSPALAVFGASAGGYAKPLATLGIHSVGDLLDHFPRRYLKMGELTDLGNLVEGQLITIMGEIVESEQKTYQDRRTRTLAYRQEVVVQGDGARLKMSFFAKKPWVAQWQESRLASGVRGIFSGQVSVFNRAWQLTNPKVVLFGEARPDEKANAQVFAMLDFKRELFPLYPAVKGLESWDLQRAIEFALSVTDRPQEWLPDPLRKRHNLPSVSQAYDWIHTPGSWDEVDGAQRYFRMCEALATQLVLAKRRAAIRLAGARPRAGVAVGGLLEQFDQQLPFSLTAGQVEIGKVIDTELAQPHPMNRLLQGEVGSGKTVVALRAMLRVVDSGGQAVLLAPTEVLAQQHYRSITALLGDLATGGMLGGIEAGTQVALLTGTLSKAAQRQALLHIASGEAGLIVGTHALLQDRVQFADLGLVVVDEQHRFGVEQRAALTDKAGDPPHVLVMTATPIPRTVAMTVFGDLEVSTLTELPAGRGQVKTTVVPLLEQPHWWDRVWQRVAEEVANGRQAYVVCPCIQANETETGEKLVEEVDAAGKVIPAGGLAAVETVATELAELPALSECRIGKLHGRLSPEEKERTMRAFAAGEVEVLVATTVIEVGVDVANAVAMVVLDADRFGVSQLHQLRGRVGRGGHDGVCLLVSKAKPESDARKRLEAVASTNDGFELSRVDLELRREGDVLGATQSGFRSSLRRLRVLRDEDTIVAAKQEAELLLHDDPELTSVPRLGEEVALLEASVASDFMEMS